MKNFENNKYLVELDKYIQNTEENKINLKKCAELRKKANNLRKSVSLKLLQYISTFDNIDLKIVEKYIKNGADVNYKFVDDMTLYMFAGMYKHIELLDFLKENGAEVLAVNKYSQNALMLAVFINTNRYDSDFYFIPHGHYLDVIRKMRSHGLDACDNYDFLGTSLNDYYLGNTEPYTKTIKNEIIQYFNNLDEEKTF